MAQSDDHDPAAELTASIGLTFRRIALVAFPLGLVLFVALLLFGNPTEPGPLIFAAVGCGLATVAALLTHRRD